jgi:hypothetical protein
MNLVLSRDLDDGRCTLGTMRIGDALFRTLERPWIPGQPGGTKGISCIPPGTYELQLHDTEAHPRSFALVNPDLDVYHYELPPGKQGRTSCLIHIANYVSELRGCIGLGMQRLLNGDAWQLGQSRVAVDRFYSLVPWVRGHTLEIR